jgi:hypothetical protein
MRIQLTDTFDATTIIFEALTTFFYIFDSFFLLKIKKPRKTVLLGYQ